MAEVVFGFYYGLVADNRDPRNLGRAIVKIPGMFDDGHPEWANPFGWPGAGAPGRGSKYPIQIGAQVAVFFEHGDMQAPPGYIPAMYGYDEGVNAGPDVLKAEQASNQDTNKTAVIWEDEALQIYVTMKDEATDGEDDRRVRIVEKSTGSNITLNATDGSNGKSVAIILEANTGIALRSNGMISLDATVVQINGRRVMRKPGVTSL